MFFVSFPSKGLMLLLGVIQRNFLVFVVHVFVGDVFYLSGKLKRFDGDVDFIW